MDLTTRLNILDQLYAIYDDYTGSLDLACQKTCAHCCTGNVVITTLEGYKIVDHFEAGGIKNWMQIIHLASGKKRFRPKTTTNKIAEDCLLDRPLPEEDIPLNGEACPFVKKDLCPLYAVRPFGCRCMVSRRNCRETGMAEIDGVVITLNTVFLQVIENLDWQGCSGNLTDVLRCLAIKKNRRAYRAASLGCLNGSLIPNRKMMALMIPPEHRQTIEPIIRDIRSIIV
jgi:hypothetical protein